MNKIKLATVWLDGCSGCHMSLLDIDEGLLAVAEKADVVYEPARRRPGVSGRCRRARSSRER